MTGPGVLYPDDFINDLVVSVRGTGIRQSREPSAGGLENCDQRKKGIAGHPYPSNNLPEAVFEMLFKNGN
jgi:hypothetical protein